MNPQKLFLSILSAALTLTPAAFSQTGYKITGHIKIGGEGRFDYLLADAQGRRLYVSHGTEVVVIDLDAEKVIGKIANTKGVHGIAVAPELNRGFISAGGENNVVVFSLDKLAEVKRIPAGRNPDCIIYEPFTKRVFAYNGRSEDATVIDAAKLEVVGTIALGGKPEFSTSDGRGNVFVNLEDKSELLQIDAQSLAVKNRWPVAPGEEPSALAMDPKTDRLFLGCGGNDLMVILDAKNGKVVASLPIGKGVDADAFDPASKRVFSSQGDGTLTVIHEETADKFVVEETIKTAPRARTMAIDLKTEKLYLPAGQYEPAGEKTAANPRPRASMKPGTFEILVLGK